MFVFSVYQCVCVFTVKRVRFSCQHLFTMLHRKSRVYDNQFNVAGNNILRCYKLPAEKQNITPRFNCATRLYQSFNPSIKASVIFSNIVLIIFILIVVFILHVCCIHRLLLCCFECFFFFHCWVFCLCNLRTTREFL